MRSRIALLALAFLCPIAASAADLFAPLSFAQSDALNAQSRSLDDLRAQRTTRGVTTVGVNTDALNADSVSIDLPTAPGLSAKTKKIERRGPNDYTWYGDLPGEPGTATLVVRNGKMTGTIRSDKALYRVQPLGDGAHALVQIDEGAFPPDHPPGYELHGNKPSRKIESHDHDAPASAAAAAPVIDVLVAYTAEVERRTGGGVALAQLAVDETNQAYENSKIDTRLRLVGTYEVSYDETDLSFDTVMNHLNGSSPGYLKTPRKLRDQLGADVVVLIIHNPDSCGLADQIMATASSAFAVAHWDCATGYYTFGHEIGHLQGARHDPATDSTNTPFRYGHGYRYKQKWRTVLAYDCPDDCPRLQYFSNPTVMYNGIPMGTTDRHNNARVINETGNTVAGFRATVVP